MKFHLLIIFTFLLTVGWAQSSKKKNTEPTQGQPTSVDPYYPQKVYEPKRKKPAGKITYDARDKFYDRMEQVVKAHRKAERELAKPQYSDPAYFGHKRPPKRKAPGKMKYCKECGLRH